MITVENVTHTYRTQGGGTITALRDVSLEIPAAEVVVLVGPSGCGKSTLLHIIAGFFGPTSGRVLADAAPITAPGTDRGVVFQKDNLFPWLTVAANVSLAAAFSGRREHLDRAEKLLELVGLGEAAGRYPHELSGGMRQRAQIARVLAAAPRSILMDEPFSALDPFTRRHLQSLLLDIWARETPTIVFVTHSVEEAIFLGDRIVTMAAGPGRVLSEVRVPQQLRRRLRRPGRDLSRLATDPAVVELRADIEARISAAHSGSPTGASPGAEPLAGHVSG